MSSLIEICALCLQVFHPTGEHPLDRWCASHEIEHKLIPIGKKELNGKVENTHKWDDREFYSQYRARNLIELQGYVATYNERWNNERATATLGWLTPAEVIYRLHTTLLFFKLWYHNIAVELGITNTEIDKYGNLMMKIGKSTNKRSKNLIKKESSVDRYLKYIEWSQNHVLPMSPSFSSLFGYKTPSDFRYSRNLKHNLPLPSQNDFLNSITKFSHLIKINRMQEASVRSRFPKLFIYQATNPTVTPNRPLKFSPYKKVDITY